MWFMTLFEIFIDFAAGTVLGFLSLEQVLWEGNRWKPVTMADLLQPAKVSVDGELETFLLTATSGRQREGVRGGGTHDLAYRTPVTVDFPQPGRSTLEFRRTRLAMNHQA